MNADPCGSRSGSGSRFKEYENSVVYESKQNGLACSQTYQNNQCGKLVTLPSIPPTPFHTTDRNGAVKGENSFVVFGWQGLGGVITGGEQGFRGRARGINEDTGQVDFVLPILD